MVKHKVRIEVFGAYYVRLIVSRVELEVRNHGGYYKTKSNAIKAAKALREAITDAHNLSDGTEFNSIPIYDYDGRLATRGNSYEVIH